MSDDVAVPVDEVAAPNDRDKALSVAYLRYTGATQEKAAEAAGVGERTIRAWEKSSWWPQIQFEAAQRWLPGLMAKARGGLERGVDQDGHLALKVLERGEPALAPPAQRVLHGEYLHRDRVADLFRSLTLDVARLVEGNYSRDQIVEAVERHHGLLGSGGQVVGESRVTPVLVTEVRYHHAGDESGGAEETDARVVLSTNGRHVAESSS